MDERSRSFLRRLLDAPGPSGYERAPARIWRAEAETFADEVTLDVAGNSYAFVRAKNATLQNPAIIFAGHIDEIGFIITHIDPEGYLWFDAIGGWDAPVAVGQRIRIVGRDGDVVGVVGKKAIHIIPPEERDKPVKLKDLWIDIGARSRAEANALVEIGDPAVIDARFVRLAGDLCASRSMDNRVGAFVALEAARLVAANRGDVDVCAVATSREEISFAGAMTAAVRTQPLAAIAIDVTHATDYPGADKKLDDEVKLGGGPVLSRGASINPVVFQALRDAAARLDIDCPIQGSGRHTGTDADPMSAAGSGAAAGLISLPNRYMHSPNETVSLDDLEQASRVLAEFARSTRPDADFRPT
ncbi:MAG TPA: M20/M25/M40 family metallo-hydrolase [Thermomicrobiales bacterium]|nr:M20/M25/M40 family metallo-hydrolase [Thermomicrobiales bacterium]